MAEKVISPGVFTSEVDASFLPAAIGEIGAVVVGPTAKGQAGIPKVVTTYSEYVAAFGDTFKSGSTSLRYLTSHVAENYLKHQGRLTVVRILAGSPTRAYANVPSMSFGTMQANSVTLEEATGSFKAFAQHAFTCSANPSFRINTLSEGYMLNNMPGQGAVGGTDAGHAAEAYTASWSGGAAQSNAFSGSNMILVSGSKYNFRWEISTKNNNKGYYFESGDSNSITQSGTITTSGTNGHGYHFFSNSDNNTITLTGAISVSGTNAKVIKVESGNDNNTLVI